MKKLVLKKPLCKNNNVQILSLYSSSNENCNNTSCC